MEEAPNGGSPTGDLSTVLRAGAAIYNAGHYHAAHDAWEDYWLNLDDGTIDEQLLHGLIQFTAVVYHGTESNWSGARGLAESAGAYLASVDPGYRGVNIREIEAYLERVAVDPETLERRDPPSIRIDGETVDPKGVSFEVATIAAPILAAELDEYDPEVVDRAVDYAREERREGHRTTFIALVRDFLGEQQHRPLVYQRLREHVQQRRRRETDVDGLFD